MSDAPLSPPAFTSWPTFPFEGELRVKPLADPVDVEPPRHGEDPAECTACKTPDSAYIWISDRWRVRALDRPTGLPTVLILESRSHLDMGDLPNLLAAELGVLTVRLERAIRSLDGVARVHVNRWGDGSAHLHVWFLARPYGRLQLRGTFLSLWDDILPRIPEQQWRENLAHVAAWLADFGGEALAEPPHIDWQSPAELNIPSSPADDEAADDEVVDDNSDDDTDEINAHGPSVDDSVGDTVLLPEGTAPVTDAVDVDRTVAIPLPRDNGDRTVNLAGLQDGGKTVNLAEVGSGRTIRFPVAAAETGPDPETGEPETGEPETGETTHTAAGPAHADTAAEAGRTADSPAADETGQRSTGKDSGDSGATVRFATSGIRGRGSETMVFPTGDAMDAAERDGDNGNGDDPDQGSPSATKPERPDKSTKAATSKR